MKSIAASICRTAGQATLIAAFVIALCVYCFKTYLNVAENVAELPKFRAATFKDWKDYPDEFTKFFEDRIAWKHLQVRRYARFKLETLGTSPTPRVWLGQHDWLFYNHEADNSYIPGDDPRWAVRRDEWTVALPEWRHWLTERGIRFLIVIPPNKQSIYPEHLPPLERKRIGMTPLDVLLAQLRQADPELPLLDLRDAVRHEKANGQLYYQTDTHWTPLGQFYGYRATAQALGFDPLPISALRMKIENKVDGDLPRQMGYWRPGGEPFENLTIINPQATKKQLEAGDDIAKLEYLEQCLYVQAKSSLPRMVMFHDSFEFTDKLAEHCSRLLAIPSNHLDPDVIAREKPDIVVFEIVERLLQGIRPRRPADPPRRSLDR